MNHPKMRISMNGSTISEAYPFVAVRWYTGRIGDTPCFLGVKTIRGRWLRPNDFQGKPFTVQVMDENNKIAFTFGVANTHHVHNHPRATHKLLKPSKA